MSGGSGHGDKTQKLSESLLNIETHVKRWIILRLIPMSTPALKIKKSSEESLLSCNAVKAFLIYTRL